MDDIEISSIGLCAGSGKHANHVLFFTASIDLGQGLQFSVA